MICIRRIPQTIGNNVVTLWQGANLKVIAVMLLVLSWQTAYFRVAEIDNVMPISATLLCLGYKYEAVIG